MKRPLALRILPGRFRGAVWSRFYAAKQAAWTGLYESAPLAYAPTVQLQLLPGDHISDQIAFTGLYESSLTRRVTELASQGGTMVDIGANLGYFSCLWAAAKTTNRCFAFEASPRNITILSENIVRNGFEAQIQLFPVAAGFERGRLNFDVGPDSQTGWGGFTLADRSTDLSAEVVRVDQSIANDTPIALLKVDVEGADPWALRGCEALIATHRVREVWYEQNKPRMRLLEIELDQAQVFLESHGYRCMPQNDPSHELVEWRAVPATLAT